jgi:hypothetical protein
VKVFGALRMMRAAWPHLAAALLAFTKVFADRGISDGVRVNAVNPGAGVVAFLLSPGGEWLQDAIIDVDGGRTKGL